MQFRQYAAVLAVALLAPGLPAFAQLETAVATLRVLPEQRSFDGRIEAVNQATVAAETRGRIEEIRADIGDLIAAGTVILTVTNTEQRAGLDQAEASLAEANANLATETAELERVSNLLARAFVSQAEMDRATARFTAARARAESADAALTTARQQLSYTEVRAPFAGVVSARYVEPGEVVQPGSLLMSGYDPDALRVEVDLPQTVADRVREIREARVVAGVSVDTPNSDFIAPRFTAAEIIPAKLILYPAADAATSTVRVRLELPEHSRNLQPGQFVRVLFTVGERQRLLIPASAIVRRSEVTAVYVVDDNIPLLRQIRPGAILDGQLEVLAGIAPGELVAIDPVAAALALTTRRDETGAVQVDH